jgi:flagellar motor switch protein FliN
MLRAADLDERLAQLPTYTRSLLRVEVPVRVTLADTDLPLKRILELGQGSIIPFAKSCEEPLVLSVGTYNVAVGEAVKVGDKFGLRITSMVMPREKFFPLGLDSPESKVQSPKS